MEDIQIKSELLIQRQGDKIGQLTNDLLMQQVVAETLQGTVTELRAEIATLKAESELPQAAPEE